jgi:hypothetical protein
MPKVLPNWRLKLMVLLADGIFNGGRLRKATAINGGYVAVWTARPYIMISASPVFN